MEYREDQLDPREVSVEKSEDDQMDPEKTLLPLWRDTATRTRMEASPLDMLQLMVPSERRHVELTVSHVASMVTLTLRV